MFTQPVIVRAAYNEREVNNMLYDMKEQSKGAYMMYCELDQLATDVDLIPTAMQLCIDALGLDQANHTQEECFEIGLHANEIYEVLILAQRTIHRYKEDREKLWEEYKKLKPETTETTK